MGTDAGMNPDTHYLGDEARTPQGVAYDAVKAGDDQKLAAILAEHEERATRPAQGPLGHRVTPLCTAAERGDSRLVEMLLEAGADPNVEANGHMTASPLAHAVRAGANTTVVRCLLREGAVPAPGEDLQDSAVLAYNPVERPHNDMLEMLLGYYPASDAALYRAVERGSPQWGKQLVDAGADPNAVNERGGERPIAPALRAVGTEDRDSVGRRLLTMLLDAGADPKARIAGDDENAGYNPRALVYAVQAGAGWAVKPLITAGADAKSARFEIERYGLRTENKLADAVKNLYKFGG